MEVRFILFRALITCTSLWAFSESAELSSIPAIFLKPIMLFNRTIVAPVFARPDYVCRMSASAKDKLCELTFNQKDLVARYKIQYGDKLDKNNYDFNCKTETFNCILNTLFNLGLSQEMLICPVVNTENGNVVNNYFLSTNYTSDQVIVFQAGNDGSVFAVVAVYDLDLDKLHANTTK